MQISLYVMNDIREICAELRRIFYASDSCRDYKDSYIINKAIEELNPELLFDPDITSRDQSVGRISKTINLRTECYTKICALADTYNITSSEICRRALLSVLLKTPEKGNTDSKLTIVHAQIQLLKKQMENCMNTLQKIEDEIERSL